jgi:hypothetical protein
LAVGLPACLFGPLVIGSVYWLLALIWTGSFALYVHGLWFFLGTAVLVIPLAFWTERRTRGRFLDEAVLDSARDRPMLHTGFADVDAIFNFATHPRLPAAGIVELILWGPRQVLDAAETVGRVRAVAKADRARAAALLLYLCTHHTEGGGGAVPTDVPVPADCPAPEWCRAIAYLLVYDCIAISTDGSRMWPHDAVLRRLTGRGHDGDLGRDRR